MTKTFTVEEVDEIILREAKLWQKKLNECEAKQGIVIREVIQRGRSFDRVLPVLETHVDGDTMVIVVGGER
jgi:hypothetical protein